jgi:MFS family permease
VPSAVRERLSESAQAFRAVFANPNLRRQQLAWGGSITGYWAYLVALAVFAYDAGGAAAVGLIGLIRMAPALTTPFIAVLADRYPRQRVMLVVDLTRAVMMAVTAAAVFADAPVALVYVLAGVVTLVSTAFRPAQAALLPSLARTPQELTAANLTATTTESVALFAGPAAGGLLLAATDVGFVFVASTVTFLWSAFNVSRIRVEAAPGAEERRRAAGILRESFVGYRTIARNSRLRVLVSLYASQTLVAGALNVLIVVSALELLEIGESGVGFLNSAVGVGGLVGGIVAFGLIGRERLASDFAVGLLLWGVPILLIGVLPVTPAALILLAFVGIGNTLVDVAGLTLLQRSVPDEVRGRVFGVLQSLIVGTLGLGAILAPALIAGVGIRGALIATGALLPILAALFWRRLTPLNTAAVPPARHVELLRGISMFTPLPEPSIESLAQNLVPVSLAADTVVFRQGDPGERFYIVGEGEVEIEVDGRAGNVLGPGQYFGEIALLRDVPRTATVTTRTDTQLYALDREEFIAAVTGHATSEEAADAVIAARLGALRPTVGSV